VTRAERLSALDAIFLPMETATQALHIGSVLVLEGPPPAPEEFRDHVTAQLATMAVARRRVLRMPLELGRPIWVESNVDPEAHLHHAVLEAPGHDDQLSEAVVRIMASPMDPGRPLWGLWQVDGLSAGRWAVVLKAHHTMVDGRTGADLVQTLLTERPADRPLQPVRAERADRATPRPVPTRTALLTDLASWFLTLPLRCVRLVLGAAGAPGETRRRVSELRLGLSQVLRPDLPPSVLGGPLAPERLWGWTDADLAAVARTAEASRCTVNDLYLAALAGGYRRFLTERGEAMDTVGLRAIVPVSNAQPGHPGRVGNLASAMFVELPVDIPEPDARLHAVAARTAEQKALGVPAATAAVLRLADHIPAPLFAWGARRYGRAGQGRVNVVASNVPGPERTQYLAGRRVLSMIPYVPTAQEIRSCSAMVSYAGRLTIAITADAEALPDADRLVAAVASELETLAGLSAGAQA
jgi:diacylglycerol O-acyltransferase